MDNDYWNGFRDGLRSAYITFKRDLQYFSDLDPEKRLIEIENHLKMHVESLAPHLTVTQTEKESKDMYNAIDSL
jgi:hypothetical protein